MRTGLHLKLVWICEVGSCVVGKQKVEKVFSLRFVCVCRGAGAVGGRGSGLRNFPSSIRVSNLRVQAWMLYPPFEREEIARDASWVKQEVNPRYNIDPSAQKFFAERLKFQVVKRIK